MIITYFGSNPEAKARAVWKCCSHLWLVEKLENVTRPPGPPLDKTMPSSLTASPQNLEQMTNEAKAFYNMNPADFNIAVIGAKAVGKSSLINGLLHMSDEDPSYDSFL